MTSVKSHRQSYIRHRTAFTVLLSAVILAAVAFSSGGVSSQERELQRRDLETVFTQHEQLNLDPGQIARQVKQTRSLTLATSRGTFEMTLEPHDMRAPGYRAEAWGDKGITVLERGPITTYKGTVRGLPAAQARFTIDEQTVEGLIITPDELLFLEPAQRYSKTAAKTDFVFYSESDLKESPGECGNTMAEIVAQHSAATSSQSSAKGPQPEAVFGPQQQIAVALEADFEYFTTFGSSASNVQTQILTIMNAVDGIYSTELGLRYSFSATNLRVWTTSADPYTSADPSVLLGQFQTSYNANPPAQGAGRDLAHLFTGRDLTGTTIGIAYQPGLDCPFDPQGYGYGLSQHLTAGNANLTGLTAHEIGHNLSATHVTSAQGSDCTQSIMNPSINSSAFNTFCQFSRDEITNHSIDNQACLTPLTQPGCTYSLSASTQNVPVTAGTSSVNITTQPGCNWAVAEGEGWITVTGGASGTGSGTVNYSVTSNSVCGPRTGLISIGDKILTVQQAGNPNYLTDPNTATAIAPFQTLNGDLSSADCPTGLTGRPNAYMDRYKFNGTAGESVLIEMNSAIPPQSGGLDTYLYLIAPNGSIVAQNDDIALGTQTNSRILCTDFQPGPCKVEYFVLPQTGTYIIIATSFGNGETGAYSLRLTPLSLFTEPGGGGGNPVATALNSVTFAKTSNPEHTAFRIFDPFNFSADQTTRLILFTTDLGLPQTSNPDPSVLSVRAGGAELVVEHAGPFALPGLNSSYVVVALKRRDGQPMLTGNLLFQVTFRGSVSNQTAIAIVP